MNRELPRLGGHHCGTVLYEALPKDVKDVVIKANAAAEEASRKLEYTVEDVLTVESDEDGGLNTIIFKMRNGTEKKFVVRNGHHGEDGNLPEIEDAIKRANEASTKVDAINVLKEAYKGMVLRGLMSEDAGTLQWREYDPAYMVRYDTQLLDSTNQLQARTNIAAAGKAEFDVLANKISSLELLSDSKVGLYSALNADLRAEAESKGYQEGLPFVNILLNYLYSLIGNATMKTTAQTLKGAVNELYDMLPEDETSDIDMTNDVFYSI